MATYDFNLNRDQVIKGALRLLGVISQGQTPDTAQVNDAAEALNVLCKAWEAEGLPLWAIKTETIIPVAGQTSYTIGNGLDVNTEEPLKVYQAWYRNNSSGIDVPMVQLVEQQYNALTNKSQQGTPVQYFYKRLNGSGIMYLFLTPDSNFANNFTVKFLFQRPFADFDTSTDVPDFPQEWLRALKYGLADEIALEYGYPQKDRQELGQRAMMYKEEALAFTQEEGSLLFKPDTDRRW